MSGSFGERWSALSALRGPVCVGLATTAGACRAWGLSEDAGFAAVSEFATTVVGRTAPLVSAFLVHTGFFERFGARGLDLLAGVTELAHRHDALVIMDAKRGDAADVATATARLYLGAGSVIGADAVVAHPYLGFRALGALFAIAAERGAHVFVLARTSNDGGAEIQLARLPDGRSVAEYVVDEVLARHECAGLVVGAPAAEAGALFARAAPALVSLPGLGRTGRTVAEFRGILADQPERAILPITSGILSAGPDGLTEAVRHWQAEVDGG